jgi:hypothetical protein
VSNDTRISAMHRWLLFAIASWFLIRPLDLLGIGMQMLSLEELLAHAEECKRLAAAPGISTRRKSILRTMARSWVALANASERYRLVLKEEG